MQSGGSRNKRYDCRECRKHNFIEGRNCQRYRPFDVDLSDLSRQWTPRYEVNGKSMPVSSITISECPVSFITEESTYLLDLFAVSHCAASFGGMALFGPSLADWPAWAVDAAATLGAAKQEYERLSWNP